MLIVTRIVKKKNKTVTPKNSIIRRKKGTGSTLLKNINNSTNRKNQELNQSDEIINPDKNPINESASSILVTVFTNNNQNKVEKLPPTIPRIKTTKRKIAENSEN